MPIRTYTAADLPTLALPGDLPGLLDGWCGPVILDIPTPTTTATRSGWRFHE